MPSSLQRGSFRAIIFPPFLQLREEWFPLARTIEVEQVNEGDFRVRVVEDATKTQHRVTLKPADYERLTNSKVQPQELIRRSFEFLLEREPKESILSQFDLTVISLYFPQYEREIKRRLSSR